MAMSQVCSLSHQEQQQQPSENANDESCCSVEVARAMTSQSRSRERKMSCSDNSLIEDLLGSKIDQTNVTDVSSCIDTPTMRTENDTREGPAAEALHHLCPLPFAVSPAPIQVSQNSAAKPRLTLSAFRRPEQTVRLTDSDPNRRFEDDYDLHAPGCRVLGRGAFSTVRLALRRVDGVKVAVKTIAKHDALSARRHRKSSRRHLDEWEILRRFQSHPNIITLLDVFETDDEIYLLTEFCPGGELFDAIQTKKGKAREFCADRYTEIQIARITRQLLSALAALHSQSVVHRDVKPENILLVNDDDSDVSVKLCDFGVARCLGEREGDESSSEGELSPLTTRPRRMSTVGSDYYIAPEVCFSTGYGTAVDIYSLGVTLFILLCGHPPVFEEKENSDESSVVFGSSRWKNVSDKAKNVIRRMLHPDPTKRITAAEALVDEWIVQYSQPVRRTLATVSSESSPLFPTLAVDLELVCTELYKRMDSRDDDCKRRDRSYTCSSINRRKRRRVNRSTEASSSSIVAAAMVDLYKDVAAAAASVTAAAAGVVCDGLGQICVFDNEDDDNNNNDAASVDGEDLESSPFGSPIRALSV